LLDLINDILEFSALESGQLKLSRTCVDLGTLASEVVREAQGRWVGDPCAYVSRKNAAFARMRTRDACAKS
jgi:signal transduction histidine kinase